MLDYSDFMARYDKQNVLELMRNLPAQLAYKFETVDTPRGGFTHILVAGMGGSALAAELTMSWLRDTLTVPVDIIRGYDLPGYVGPGTLVVCTSYSGNTEETSSALDIAERRGARIAVIAAGGQLLDRSRKQGYPSYALPGDLAPKMAVFAGVRAWAQLLEDVGVGLGLVAELEAAGDWLQNESVAWAAGVATPENEPKRIAAELVGHPVVIYAGPVLESAGLKWKMDLNENAKNITYNNNFPELNHNELSGWQYPVEHGLKVVELTSSLDRENIARRQEITNRLLSDRFAPIVVQAAGQTKLEQLLWTSHLGGYVSVYLALLNQTDPAPVPLAEKLKAELS